MVNRGTEAIVFASCISKGNPISYLCLHYANMIDKLINKIGSAKQELYKAGKR